MKNTVVITHARPMDYRKDYVHLPHNYGSAEYYAREDIQAIQQTVNENLTLLNEKTGFTRKIEGKKVVIKPNLVEVCYQLGFKDEEYPESTDPRVLDAVVCFIKKYTDRIAIVESSGRGMPTRGSFYLCGLDRLAKHHGTELLCLEEQPTDRYILPKAKIMQEIVVPRIFSEIIEGKAFYISMPKMKTNLYTGVTLGFKNAMGVLPYNLRQRNHTFDIDQKLVDMLYLFRPDLVIIDGIIGGEGNTPAPVEPVDTRVIISGNQPVETDRVATRMMGFDPDQIRLIHTADEMGFGDPDVEIIGEPTVTPFKAADPSLFGPWMKEHFPTVRILQGHPQAARFTDAGSATPAAMLEMEHGCRGGCLATIRFAFDMLWYEGHKIKNELTIINGRGIQINGETTFFDRDAKPYTVDDIRKLGGKKLAIGACTKCLKDAVTKFVDGCMPFPNSPHMAIHQMSGTWCSVMSPRNKHLLPLLFDTLAMCESRKKFYRKGIRLDVDLINHPHRVEPRVLTEEEKQQDFIRWDFDPLTPAEIRELKAIENRAVLATFLT